MTRVRKYLLITLALLLISQIPFAYRRYRLRRLQAAIAEVNSSRSVQSDSRFIEYKGVVHVHSFLGGHSDGSFQEIISAAQENNLQFVVMTEHVEHEIDTAKMTLSGVHESVLFINGNEVATSNGDRLLSIPGDGSLSASTLSTAQANSNVHARGAISFVAYPAEFKSWSETFDGIEVYNVFTNSKRINLALAFFDSLWSHRAYPDLMFANYLERPNESLKKLDELTSGGRRVVAIAGNDSHANIGFHVQDSSGKSLIGVQLDPYTTSFRLVRVHVLVQANDESRSKPLSPDEVIAALRNGNCFIGFDLLGDTSGFRFEALNSKEQKLQGDEIQFDSATKLRIALPNSGRILLFRNGEIFLDQSDVRSKEVMVPDRGVYRVEVYLPQLGPPAGNQPWIISNPIYVR